MKKSILFAAIIALSFMGCDDKTNGNQHTVIEQKKLDLVSGKPNIIFLTREHCGSCEELKETIKVKEISSLLESKFNLIFLDINDASLLPKGLAEPIGTPILYFVDASGGELIEPLIGATDSDNLIELLDAASKSYSEKYQNAK